jgi:lysophospholipase L1-like esterase
VRHASTLQWNIRPQDILIVSVGANDIALKPLPCTIRHMLQLAWATPRSSLEKGTASSLKYFNHMFCDKVQDYVDRMTSNTRPRAVIICMIYYPLESGLGQSSWADTQLKALGYNTWPGQLQTAISTLYGTATQKIKIQGTHVVPCALHEVLDGKTAKDYTERVEPNEEGGKKMADRFVKLLETIWSPPLQNNQDTIQ